MNEKFYTDQDLAIGQYVNVYGRKVLLVDCDEFTKNYYRTKYGIQDFTPLEYKKTASYEPLRQTYPCMLIFSFVDPFIELYSLFLDNGFGSEEDSLNSTKKLLPDPVKKDFNKFMGFDR